MNRAGGLVEHRQPGVPVHPLHILRGADRTVHVGGGRAVRAVAFKVQQRVGVDRLRQHANGRRRAGRHLGRRLDSGRRVGCTVPAHFGCHFDGRAGLAKLGRRQALRVGLVERAGLHRHLRQRLAQARFGGLEDFV